MARSQIQFNLKEIPFSFKVPGFSSQYIKYLVIASLKRIIEPGAYEGESITDSLCILQLSHVNFEIASRFVM